MATIRTKTFPGVYTQIVDRSYLLPQTSRFAGGLVGVARKGTFDTPTAVRSLQEFQRLFGQPLAGDYFLANAVAILSDLTDGLWVVRVGLRSESLPGAVFTASALSVTGTVTPYAKGQVLDPTVWSGQGDVYVTVKQAGLEQTVNQVVTSVGSIGPDSALISFTDADAIKALYTSATVEYSIGNAHANEAQAALYAYTYGSNSGDPYDAPLYGGSYQVTASGDKGDYEFQLIHPSTYTVFAAGDLLKLVQTGKADTQEVRVRQALPDGRILLETTDLPGQGYQALALQDSYTAATVYRKTGALRYITLEGASAGDWANSADISAGLFVKVRPGGAANTKKFEVYEDGALVETVDNLYNGAGTLSWSGRINGNSQLISVVSVATSGTLNYLPANYSYGYEVGAALINAGINSSGGAFGGGYNGEAAGATDFIGRYDPATDRFTGIQSFIDTQAARVDLLCCPGVTDGGSYDPLDGDTNGLHRMMYQVANRINALALIDIPPGLNARQAIDWHNGAGLYSGRGRLDSYNISCFWNWFTISDPFTGEDKSVPPTLGALRCLAFTFDRDKPWYVAAGDVRGLIPEAKFVEFEHVSDDTRQSMYGNGQSVNGIFLDRAQIKLWGERTMQVAESKLSVNHNVILVNYVVNNLSEIGRRFIFEPNDPELLVRVRLAYTQFLDNVKTERGIEEYLLVIDDTNNTPDTRNNREVIVDLAIIPTDSVERIFITATVRESGAILDALQAE
jgi:hypothetical protein